MHTTHQPNRQQIRARLRRWLDRHPPHTRLVRANILARALNASTDQITRLARYYCLTLIHRGEAHLKTHVAYVCEWEIRAVWNAPAQDRQRLKRHQTTLHALAERSLQ